MAKINKGRMFAELEGDYVVFLIGMRINSLWKFHKWFPVIMAMPRMIKELITKPEYGFLGSNAWFGRTTLMLQYWRSFDHLEAYAKNKSLEHFPAWKEFNVRARQSGAVGIWHETYKISEGSYENIYVNMPSFGLGKAGRLLSVSEKYDEARSRMNLKTN
jgi:hypothetical protein